MNQTPLFPTFPRRSFLTLLCASLLLGCGRESQRREEVVDDRPVDFEEIQRQIREADEIMVDVSDPPAPRALTSLEQETLADLFTADNAVPVQNDRKRMCVMILQFKNKGEPDGHLSLWLDDVVEVEHGFLLLKRPPHTDPRLPFHPRFQPLARDE